MILSAPLFLALVLNSPLVLALGIVGAALAAIRDDREPVNQLRYLRLVPPRHHNDAFLASRFVCLAFEWASGPSRSESGSFQGQRRTGIQRSLVFQ